LTVDRPLCIRASAGSGKTGVLAHHHAALLLTAGLKPSEVVAVTFTEKAAGELQTRIQEVLNRGASGQLDFQDRVALKPFEIEGLLKEIPHAPISTLHSLAARIVREASLLTGFDPHFEVLDANQAHALKMQALSSALSRLLDQESAPLKELIRSYGFGTLKRQLVKMLEDWPRWKTPLVGATRRVAQDTGDALLSEGQEIKIETALNETFAAVLSDYENSKRRRRALDFDDLEEEALKLLRDHPLITRHYRKLWKAYLIDEFQDVSEKQDALISALLEIGEDGLIPRGRHLAVVGDEKQSIYSFRGAEPMIFEKFQERIERSGGTTVTLARNFRSPPLILRWVNAHFAFVFENYPPLEAAGEDPPDASLEVLRPPLLGEGEKIKAEGRRLREAEALSERVAGLLREGHHPGEIFFLFRNMTYAPLYLKALRERKIPVYLSSSESLLEKQEVLDLIHALKAVAQPDNPLPWVGLLRSPAFGLSDEDLLRHALTAGKKKTRFSDLHPLFAFLKNRDPREGPYEFLSDFLEKTGLISLYGSHPDLSRRAQNVLQFLHGAHTWEAREGGGLEAFLKDLDLMARNRIPWETLSDRLGAGEAVTLMTIHQAKGLDFPVVILPDLGAGGQPDLIPIAERFREKTGLRLPRESEGLKPICEESETLAAIKDEQEKLASQEEERIFYVAATRAKKRLILGFLPNGDKEERRAFAKLSSSLGQSPGVVWIGEAPSDTKGPSANPEPEEVLPMKPLSLARLTRFAVTELECFLRSKEEYREKYVYKIPSRTRPETGSRKPEESGDKNHPASSLDPLERGIIVHEALCLMTRPRKNLTSREALKLVWDRRFELQEDFAAFEVLLGSLEKTLGHPSFQPIGRAQEGYSEIPFLLNLHPYRVRGAMDRLIRSEGDWVVVDYKTHASPDEKTARSFEFQMKTYCLAAGRMLGKEVREAQLYFVEPNSIHPFRFSSQEILAHEKKLVALMDEINEWRETWE